MSDKGFTVVELIASFALTMIISVFLFEVLIDVKNIFIETSIKTSIIEKVGVISKNIKMNVQKKCNSSNCNGLVSSDSNSIIVNEQSFNMPSGVTVSDFSLSNPECNSSDCTVTVSFKLNNANFSEPYNYKAVYYYSTS